MAVEGCVFVACVNWVLLWFSLIFGSLYIWVRKRMVSSLCMDNDVRYNVMMEIPNGASGLFRLFRFLL